MTPLDLPELRRIAEAAREDQIAGMAKRRDEFRNTFPPLVVLELIGEIERLRTRDLKLCHLLTRAQERLNDEDEGDDLFIEINEAME